MDWTTSNLDELLARVWQSLEAAPRAMDHPFRAAGFATAVELELAARIVILRGVDPAGRTLTCYSDVRTTKARHLRENPQVQWLFHDPAARVQIRASGEALVHHENPVTITAWNQLPVANRLNYATKLAPGNRLAQPDDALPVAWREREPKAEELEFAREHFAVITTCVDHFDWLQLGSPMHRRAGFTWVGDRFSAQWLVP